MILECASCGTRYLVPDTAIGPQGRTVRCANCRHSWFQDGAPEAMARAIADAPAAPPTPPVATPADETPGEDYDAFGYRAPFRPRRNPARRYTAIAAAAGCVMLLAVGAVSMSGAAGIAAQLGLAGGATGALQIRQNPVKRSPQPSGAELFAVSGQVVNHSQSRQRVGDILAELRDAQGRAVYSWTITPEARVVAPGGRVEFKSAIVNVPDNAKRLDLSFASTPLG